MPRKFENLTGRVFGERVVKRFSHQREDSRNVYWVVQCSCGREDSVCASVLRSGRSTRCQECSGRENGKIGLYSQSKNLPVYFIRCVDWVKVGSSANVERRLKDIQCSNPFEVLLLKIDVTKSEQEWHDMLKKCHYKGEWYWFSDVCEIIDLT